MPSTITMAPTSSDQKEWRAFLRQVFTDRVVERRTWHRAGQELPSFHDWSYATFSAPGVAPRLRDGLDNQRQPDERDVGAYADWGALRAEQGVPIEEALHVFHLYRSELNKRAAEVGGTSDPASRMRLAELSGDWLDAGLLAALRAHRAAVDERPQVVDERRTALLRSVLIGGMAPLDACGELERYGLDPSRRFHAIRARPTSEVGVVKLHRYVQDTAGARGRVLVGSLEGDVCGIAEHLPAKAAPVPVGVSEPVPVAELSRAFARASRAHATALALGRPGVHNLASLGAYPSILADGDVSEALMARYIAPLRALGTLGNGILETVEHYLRSDCALSPTAGDLYLHVNSVRYRLRKFEEITGCSLKSSEALAEIWWALARQRMLGDRSGPVG
jgi:hypothetical protein